MHFPNCDSFVVSKVSSYKTQYNAVIAYGMWQLSFRPILKCVCVKESDGERGFVCLQTWHFLKRVYGLNVFEVASVRAGSDDQTDATFLLHPSARHQAASRIVLKKYEIRILSTVNVITLLASLNYFGVVRALRGLTILLYTLVLKSATVERDQGETRVKNYEMSFIDNP